LPAALVAGHVVELVEDEDAASTVAAAVQSRGFRLRIRHIRHIPLFMRVCARFHIRHKRLLDVDGARLHVDQQLVPTRGGCTFGPPKSARSRRTIALDPETVDALTAHRETQQLERGFAADAYQDGDLVFCDELGGPVHPQRLTEWFTGHRKAAGIPTGTLHTLRHTAATLALTAGVPVHIAAARLGDTPQTVLSTYAHLLPQSDELAAERVAAAIA
jgi:integrase